jgi:hypothetical protein
MQKTSMMAPLGGDAGDLRAPTINAKNIDSGPLGRRCRESGNAHHQCWKMSTVGPLGGAVGESGSARHQR